jgi:molybdopterin converting factor small subunit
MIVIHFYGSIADRVGRSVELDLPDSVTTVAELRELLGTTYPHAAVEIVSGSLKACIDDEVVGEAHDIRRAGTIEFFPPLSGG